MLKEGEGEYREAIGGNEAEKEKGEIIDANEIVDDDKSLP